MPYPSILFILLYILYVIFLCNPLLLVMIAYVCVHYTKGGLTYLLMLPLSGMYHMGQIGGRGSMSTIESLLGMVPNWPLWRNTGNRIDKAY